MPEVVKVTKS